MGNCNFFPVGNKAVKVKFKCDACGHEVETEEITIPEPNYMAEKSRDSYRENDDYAVCKNCEKEFNISVCAGFGDGYVDINEIDDDIEVEEIYEDLDEYYEDQIDAIIHSDAFIDHFKNNISNLKSLNNIELGDDELQEVFKRQIYSGAITILEDYLSTTLIKHVLENNEYFRKYVRTYKNIKNRKFSLSEIYERLDSLSDIVKKELVDIMYHNIPKVRTIYNDVFGIDFPPIEDVMKIVSNRHDMVHRNGKNKDGELVEITKDIVDEVIITVESFIENIDLKIAELE